VRFLDPAGQPVVAANVLLVAHMADGTLESIAMGALSPKGNLPCNGADRPLDSGRSPSPCEHGRHKLIEVPVSP